MLTLLFSAIAKAPVATECAKPTFFGLRPWYQYLTLTKDQVTGKCEIANFTPLGGHSSVLLIALAVIDDLIRLAALIAVGYVIYGGFLYITSQGSPDMTKKGQQTVINALIGLATAIIASAVVGFIGNRLGT